MKAVVARRKRLVLDIVDTPVPGPGQVLVKTLHCGICGSDLHGLHHFEELISAGKRSGLSYGNLDPDKDIIFGHEFCAEIVDFGPSTRKTLPVGSAVCSLPIVPDNGAFEGIGYSQKYPGGYGQYMILSEAFLLPVPNGLASEVAALTEPLAVGAHAVARADQKDSVFLVVGCGPVGLAIIAQLKAAGLGPVIASDFVAERRRLAELFGADKVVDPAQVDPHQYWQEFGVPRGMLEATAVTGRSKRAVIFECVGVPNILSGLINAAPRGAQIIVAGVCMQVDKFEPFMAINRELELRFVLAYNQREFRTTLRDIAEGTLKVKPMITDIVDLDGVAAAFQNLESSPSHAKILVRPSA